jgi:hypothetical protein
MVFISLTTKTEGSAHPAEQTSKSKSNSSKEESQGSASPIDIAALMRAASKLE